jgi:hypothetical protein
MRTSLEGGAIDGTIMQLHLPSKRATIRKNKRYCSEVKLSVSAASADSATTGYLIHFATGLSSAHYNQLTFGAHIIIVCRHMHEYSMLPAVTLSMQ